MEVLLGVALKDAANGSRLGGTPPVEFTDDPLLNTHDYLLTLEANTAPWLDRSELSVFVRRGYGIGDPDDPSEIGPSGKQD